MPNRKRRKKKVRDGDILIEGMTVVPPGTEKGHQKAAFCAAVNWGLNNVEALAAYESETGDVLRSSLTDCKTLAQAEKLIASAQARFADWFAVNVWGHEPETDAALADCVVQIARDHDAMEVISAAPPTDN